jgi:hypothetical protein
MPDRPSSSSYRASARRESTRDSVSDLYEILEVSPRASQDVIHAAYRVLARNCHPDHNASFDAAGTMRKLNAAYAVLKDPERRARYDLECSRARRAVRAIDLPPATGPVGPQIPSRAAQARLQYVGSAADAPRVRLTPQLTIVLVLFALLVTLTLLLAAWSTLDGTSMADLPVDRFGSVVEPSSL